MITDGKVRLAISVHLYVGGVDFFCSHTSGRFDPNHCTRKTVKSNDFVRWGGVYGPSVN